ncbi:hypothetical protein [Sporolactobacillus pectinivorans]|uniref:hypothetical protein n=1 Tax=Sporolactobacillus pectinivorans TaxID=1591408 RepID=UPI000C26B66E|nr:hypothetical protein [Sporolactobacillus pectinivorans]
MKSIIKCGLVICTSSLFLVSCGTDVANEKSVNMNKILKDDNEHISYIVTDENSLSKDSTIGFYILSKNGKAKLYDGTDETTVSKIAKMDKKEIKNQMKKEDKEYFETDKKDVLELVDKNPDEVKDTKYKEPKAQKIKMSSSSSDKSSFKFLIHGFDTISDDYQEDPNEDTPTKGVYVDNRELKYDFDKVVNPKEFSDKKFAGLKYYDDIDEVNEYLITRVGDKAKEVEMGESK